MTNRLFHLTEMHVAVDSALRLELARHAPDPVRLAGLSQRKLRIKQTLKRLMPSALCG